MTKTGKRDKRMQTRLQCLMGGRGSQLRSLLFYIMYGAASSISLNNSILKKVLLLVFKKVENQLNTQIK